MLGEAEKVLRRYFGYPAFREGQANMIRCILERHDAFAIMPTGAGKSICYQVPALMFSEMTLVVSPLISLMKDQVDALNSLGIAATYINSSLSKREVTRRIAEAKAEKYRLIYVAPERLESEEFIQLLQTLQIGLLAIDEAHCVSQWGHDFRPSYRQIIQFVNRLPTRPVMAAFTATATAEVKEDVIKLLGLNQPQVYVSGFDRPNLSFSVVRGQNKDQFIMDYLAAHPGDSGIIYAATRKEVDKLSEMLNRRNYRAGKYHAGMNDSEREKVQESFVYDNIQLMVATNAFGMGIDKSNVRFVIHYNLPKNMESYYQEAGRAGRDGEPGECTLLFSPQDIVIQKFLIEQSVYSPVRKKNEFKKLQTMIDYVHTSKCLRRFILEYFEEAGVAEQCGNCGNCCADYVLSDITTDAQKVFSCIARMREQYGVTMIAEVLKGAKTKRISQFRFNKLPTYGIMAQRTTTEIKDLINLLIAEGYLQLTESAYPVVKLQSKAHEVLKDQAAVVQRKVVQQEVVRETQGLFEQLRQLRKQIAEREGVAPYIVFSDSALREMCRLLPVDLETFSKVRGVGERKLHKYGFEFMDVITAYRSTLAATGNHPKVSGLSRSTEQREPPSHIQTFDRFKSGQSLAEIAAERQLTVATIQGHLLRCAEEGLAVNWDRLISSDEEQLVLEQIRKLATIKVGRLKEALPESVDYFTIRAVIAKSQQGVRTAGSELVSQSAAIKADAK